MHSTTWQQRRQELETYFDRTAAAAWERLTSSEPVGRIRATVRAGRDEMRATLLGWLGEDLRGKRVLDAGCGTGALAIEAARRGAEVVAIDAADAMVRIARDRLPADIDPDAIRFMTGDMLAEIDGEFDYTVAMDSLIHYREYDVLAAAGRLAARTRRSLVFTIAPRTPALSAMHFAGRLLPHREHRAPAIVPHNVERIRRTLDSQLAESGFRCRGSERVSSGFYISQALELVRG